MAVSGNPAAAAGAVGVTQDSMRRQNLSSILAVLLREGELSRTELVAATGLTRAGVASLLKELGSLGLVAEREVRSSDRVGRPSSHAQLVPDAHVSVSLEITTSAITAVSRDLRGVEVSRTTRTIDRPSRQVTVLGAAREVLDEMVAGEQSRGRALLGVAVIVPALVAGDRRRVVSSPALGWHDVDVADALETPDRTVVLDNYSNFAAIADSMAYPGAQVVHMRAGEGVGAGTAIDGVVQRGGGGFAGAIGHLPMDLSGPRCSCGRNGCLEVFANVSALLRRAAPDLEDAESDAAIDALVVRAADGDERALAGIAETGRWLGRGVAAMINVVSPSAVLLGGYVPSLRQWILPPLLREAHSGVVVPDLGGCIVAVGDGGTSATERGAALSVQQDAFSAEGLRVRRRGGGGDLLPVGGRKEVAR